MADVSSPVAIQSASRLNVSDRLTHTAALLPDAIAVVSARRGSSRYHRIRAHDAAREYSAITFGELDADAESVARGLVDWGVQPGTRLALLVRPGIEFVTLVFGLLRAGVVLVLVDPGLGRRNLVECLAAVEPEGFVAVPMAQAARLYLRRRFDRAKWNVTVGRRWFWGGLTLDRLRTAGASASMPKPRGSWLPVTRADDPAAIIFTSGSTGPPKGVLYTQQMFDTQAAEIQSTYGIAPGSIDLSCFPLFALFNSAMGVTTVLPEMDFSRPGDADPEKLFAAANDWHVTQSFASPAVWRKLSAFGRQAGRRIASLRQIFSCGAAVPADVLRDTLAMAGPDARMHTPYGATECLPVSTIEAAEVFEETALRTDQGGGVCVGKKFDTIQWRVVPISDAPLASIDDVEELPVDTIGELVVRGPQASPRYVTCTDWNARAKIPDATGTWHRMGDIGYFDEQGRFWYCGRKSQRVETASGPLFTECVEAIFAQHPLLRRCALVGIGSVGKQTPVLVYETIFSGRTRLGQKGQTPEQIETRITNDLTAIGAKSPTAASIRDFLRYEPFPVDIRHNSKIQREALARWAARQLPELA
jgi:olefin beta-lactone synthetase